MIEESGRILEIDGIHAWIETDRRSACSGCAVNSGCGTGMLARLFEQRRTRVRALNSSRAGVGEQVVIGLAEQALVRGSLAVYAVPLLGLLAGALFGEYLAGRLHWQAGEGLSIGAGIAGLVAGLWWARHFTRRIRDDVRYQPVVLRRVDAHPESLS